MPKRTDIKSILILGAGPIVIGQACEFDYSGAQACKALKEEGYRVILVNSNPATIMTDPALADATYIEPICWENIEKIIEREAPDALLPTMGGQTALNCALDLCAQGILKKHNITMIGATKEAIDRAEDREQFSNIIHEIGLETPLSGIAHSLEDALKVLDKVGFPAIIRPSFTLGGAGGGIAYHHDEFLEICRQGLALSPTHELLIDQSIQGWKEYEMEVVRDKNDNCMIVCSIENIDPMGIHTGDSITVAPALTLTDKEYQHMRDASLTILRAVGVETGGSNVQFAINPENGKMVVIEMNPRVSRSSALASKATGFPIAKVAAKLAVGYTLDELTNEMTGHATPISFEPTIDYIVTKIPRFNFEKFPKSNHILTTQMKSVGEVMAMGRTFAESLQKALASLEIGTCGFDPILDLSSGDVAAKLEHELCNPSARRLWYVADAFRYGMSVDTLYQMTRIDRWFLSEIENIITQEHSLIKTPPHTLPKTQWQKLKSMGFSDQRLADLWSISQDDVRKIRLKHGIHATFLRVDSCAAEFEAHTAYMYSSYSTQCESQPSNKKKIMILGGGPNRIGQGIEFDYCCVHAALGLRDKDCETIMVNCNPETVSTDFDTADRLYFEPLTLEHILNIVDIEQPDGLIVHYGGQTPLKLAQELAKHGVPIIGTSPDNIDCAEDRDRFGQLVQAAGLLQPENGIAKSHEQAYEIAHTLGFPILARPSYVLGGRAMEILNDMEDLTGYLREHPYGQKDNPLLLDQFLQDAIEIDVDALCDGTTTLIAGIMQHIEQAGVHSGDSTSCLPAYDLSADIKQRLKEITTILAQSLNVIGLMNIQCALIKDKIYILEVNPRASRTIPFVSKATGVPLAQIAAKIMAGISLEAQNITEIREPSLYCVKRSVFPFRRFSDADPLLGPEMRSTGEVMGVGTTFHEAYNKALMACHETIPCPSRVLISVRDQDKPYVIEVARILHEKGCTFFATQGTAEALEQAGIPHEVVKKVNQGRPHIVDLIKNNGVDFIINTTEGKYAIADSYIIRKAALQMQVNYSTNMDAVMATAQALSKDPIRTPYCLQKDFTYLFHEQPADS